MNGQFWYSVVIKMGVHMDKWDKSGISTNKHVVPLSKWKSMCSLAIQGT